jgi:acetylornithine deacetylase/succinyl-diaminopimelate desuccinylase-like protein
MPSRSWIFLATPDEESGGRLGAGFVAREHPELLGDAEYLLTEGGSIRAGGDTPPVWAVATAEKTPCWLELSTLGTPGHSSAPDPDAAVPRLIAALDRVRRYQTPIRVVPEVAAMFRQLAPLAAPEDRAGARDLDRALREDGDFRRRFLQNRGNNAVVRDTISITVLEGSARTNVAPAEARAHLDIRLLPGERCEDMSAALKQVIDDPGVRVRTLLAFPSNRSPTDTPLFRAIERVAARTDPEALVVPRLIAGFTDAHWFRELGIVAYGFVPRRLSARDTSGIHGVNEQVSIANLEEGVRTLIRILDELR